MVEQRWSTALAIAQHRRDAATMDLEALLTHYFGTDDLDAIPTDVFARGQEKMRIDFGVEREPGRRFALWTLMDGIGIAPLPAEAFGKREDALLKRAAEDYLSAAWKLERE